MNEGIKIVTDAWASLAPDMQELVISATLLAIIIIGAFQASRLFAKIIGKD